MSWSTCFRASLARRRWPQISNTRSAVSALLVGLCLAAFSAPCHAVLVGYVTASDTGAYAAFDGGWVNRLQTNFGYSVVKLGDNEALPINPMTTLPYGKDDFDVLIVSGAVASGNFLNGPIGLNTRTAQITYENAIYDEVFAATGPTPSGNASLGTQLDIVNSAHPLAAGLSLGLNTVYSTATNNIRRLDSITGINPAVQVVANDSIGRPSIMFLPAGATINTTANMPSNSNPGLKIATFANEGSTFGDLTLSGLALLDASVAYALANKVAIPEPSSTLFLTSASLMMGLLGASKWRRKKASQKS